VLTAWLYACLRHVLKVRSLLSFAVKHFMCVIAVTISQLLLFICIGYKFGITYYMVNLLLYTCIEDLVTMGYYREVMCNVDLKPLKDIVLLRPEPGEARASLTLQVVQDTSD
jgi:hypothetical protein